MTDLMAPFAEPTMNDHDLLIRIDEKVTGMQVQLSGFTGMLDTKADVEDVDALGKTVARDERRIARLERAMWILLGIIFAVQFLGPLLHIEVKGAPSALHQ